MFKMLHVDEFPQDYKKHHIAFISSLQGKKKNCKNCSLTKFNVNLMPTTEGWLREEIRFDTAAYFSCFGY
jgi:hypothetical protein